ncbi:hypothetical protein ACFWX8_39435, partial [Streptomyces violascens]
MTQHRLLSQMEPATPAEISPPYLGFIENGRSVPNRTQQRRMKRPYEAERRTQNHTQHQDADCPPAGEGRQPAGRSCRRRHIWA